MADALILLGAVLLFTGYTTAINRGSTAWLQLGTGGAFALLGAVMIIRHV